MARWSLFNKSKSKQEEQMPEEEIQEETAETTESEKAPLAQHTETLYAEGSGSKKSSSQKIKPTIGNQQIWRDMNAIEENVDNLHKKKTTVPSSELDRTVDKLLAKRKRK